MILIYLEKEGNPEDPLHWHVYHCPSGGIFFDGNKGNWRARWLVMSGATTDARLVEDMSGIADDSKVYSRWIYNRAIANHQQVKGPSL